MQRKRKLKDALDRLFSSPRQEPSAPENIPAVPVPAPTPVVVPPPPAPRPAPKPEPVAEAAAPYESAQAAEEIKANEEAAAKRREAAMAKPEHHLVVFQLCGQHYGVDIAAVESIIKMQPITLVPRTLAFVEGVTNLRGTVLPVFDLRKRFGLPPQEPTKDTRIITIQLPGNTAGIIVDSVLEVLRVPEDLIEPPPPIATTADSTYLVGIAKVNDQFVILLDLSQVLTTEEKVVLPSFKNNGK
jgi:purine-binding chemotaxis protein CheW